MVDPNEQNKGVRVLFYLECAIQDGRINRDGKRNKISQELLFVEIDSNKNISNPGYAPYLDYRPITEAELPQVYPLLEADWLNEDLESEIKNYAVKRLIPQQLSRVKEHRENLVHKRMDAVQKRLQYEVNYWEDIVKQGKEFEEWIESLTEADRTRYEVDPAKVKRKMENAEQRVDEFRARLNKRVEEAEQELHISAMPPQVIGGALIVPQCLLDTSDEDESVPVDILQTDRARIDRLAVDAVMEAERDLGHEPKEMPHQNPGFDIESKDSKTNQLRFIEVKGKSKDATTVTISKTQILTALNKPDSFILAIVVVEDEAAKEIHYIRKPFEKDLDFGVTSVNYDLKELLDRSEEPS